MTSLNAFLGSLVQRAFMMFGLALLSLALTVAPSAGAADVEYTYDEIGRLVGVYAPNGDAAQYIYDAAGNITEIKRFSSTQLSIIEFTPNAGPVGTQVQIYGTGFSTTPANNAVTFNGTAATVSASTANRLTVTVPTGATTGAIGVTVGAANANSTSSFVVTASTGAPTITSFSPAGGAATTAVTISGTNFETTASANTVVFNNTYATASSSSGTSITTAVPTGAASGKIKVRTLRGTAYSSTDFLVPFGSYTVADLVTSARIAVDGSATNFSIATAGKVAMILFDGVQGQSLGIGLGPLTYTPSGGSATVYVKRPDNLDLITSVAVSSATSIDLPPLPLTGTYTIAIVPGAAYRMDGTVTLSTDLSGAIGVEGSTLNATTTRAGQNGTFTFNGTAGQKAAVYLSGLSAAIQVSKVDLIGPSGYALATVNSSGATAYIQALSLPLTGKYKVRVSPVGNGVGSWSVQWGVPDLTVTSVTLGSPSVNQNGSYSIPITAIISNQGTVGAATYWYDYAYLSSDASLDGTDRRLINPLRTAAVPSGTSYTLNLTGTSLTSATPGNYYVIFKTDGYDSGGLYVPTPTGLTESNEENNVASAAAVTLPQRPDLTIAAPTIGTISANQSGSYNVPVTATVTNQGGSAAKAYWWDECYLSSDASLTTADAAIGSLIRGSDLAAAAQYTFSKTCIVPSTVAAGSYTLFVKTDGYDSGGMYSATSVVTETDETNNVASTTVELPTKADLSAGSVSVGSITVNGNGSYNIPITVVITNAGGIAAKANWYDYCYLSTDGTLDTTDDYIGFTLRTVDLDPSAQYTFTKTCVTATTTTAGAYTLFAKTDGYNSGAKYSATSLLTEGDETNNVSSIAITLPPK